MRFDTSESLTRTTIATFSTEVRLNGVILIDVNDETLGYFADKYIWWKTREEALTMPERVVAQVMNIGDYNDVQTLIDLVGDDVLRKVLLHAEAGQFNARS